MLELSARPDTTHVLGAMGGMVNNVWLKLAIYCVWSAQAKNPGYWLSARDGTPGYVHVMGGKRAGQRVDIYFS